MDCEHLSPTLIYIASQKRAPRLSRGSLRLAFGLLCAMVWYPVSSYLEAGTIMPTQDRGCDSPDVDLASTVAPSKPVGDCVRQHKLLLPFRGHAVRSVLIPRALRVSTIFCAVRARRRKIDRVAMFIRNQAEMPNMSYTTIQSTPWGKRLPSTA